MAQELIYTGEDGTLGFGDYTLAQKTKKDGFSFAGDLYKVKTFGEITKLEKNENFLYESVPGTKVTEFKETENGITFTVEGAEDAQITLGLEEDCEYDVVVAGSDAGRMQTGLGGKLSLSIELAGAGPVKVCVTR